MNKRWQHSVSNLEVFSEDRGKFLKCDKENLCSCKGSLLYFSLFFFFLSSPHDINILESTSKSRFFPWETILVLFLIVLIVLKVQREMFLKQGRQTSQYFKIFIK